MPGSPGSSSDDEVFDVGAARKQALALNVANSDETSLPTAAGQRDALVKFMPGQTEC